MYLPNLILDDFARIVPLTRLFMVFYMQSPIHSRALAVARHILGDDMAFDFDMLIYKVEIR